MIIDKALAKVFGTANERELKVAITGFGTADDLTVNYFRAKGLKLTSVPFAKPGERYAAVVGGNADLLYEQAGDVRSFLEAGQLKPVIHFAKARGDFPDVPTATDNARQMRVAIDARKLHDFGIGTYIRNLLRHLARIDQTLAQM